MARAPISVIRCIDRFTCSAPELQVDGCIRAPTLGSREASVIWAAQPPRTVLMIKKWRDNEVLAASLDIAEWIEATYPHVEIVVYEEAPVAAGSAASGDGASPPPAAVLAAAGPATGVQDESELRSVADAADVSAARDARTTSKLLGGVRGASGEAAPVSAAEAGVVASGATASAMGEATRAGAAPPAGGAASSHSRTAQIDRSVTSTEDDEDEDGEACDDATDGESLPPDTAWPAKYRRFYGEAAAATTPSSATVSATEIDLIVAVGGDGTVLHASSLFQAAMPPIIAVAFGSLGFMTGHSLKSIPEVFAKIMGGAGGGGEGDSSSSAGGATASGGSGDSSGDSGRAPPASLPPLSPEACAPCKVSAASYEAAAAKAVAAAEQAVSAAGAAGAAARPPGFRPCPVSVSLRMRLKVDVYKQPPRCSSKSRRSGGGAGATDAALASSSTRGDATCVASFVVLNELLLERGPCPYMATLAAYVDDEPLTTVHADGLIICTQTGSTAYSLSAGGSILSPNTAAIVFTPICPHTLSFRPLLFPDSAVIRLEVPPDARSSAWCSFDGRHSMELGRGDYVVVQSSPWPLPLICRGTACGDWIRSIKTKLYWNVREAQKGFGGGAAPSSRGKRRLGSEAALLGVLDEGAGEVGTLHGPSSRSSRGRGHSSFRGGDTDTEGEDVLPPSARLRR